MIQGWGFPHTPRSSSRTETETSGPLSAGPLIYVTVSAISGRSFALPVLQSRPSDMFPQKRSSREAVLQKIDLHHPASQPSLWCRPASANYIREPPLPRRFETALLLHSCSSSMPYPPSTSRTSMPTVRSIPFLLFGLANAIPS